jgi:hypothetical protein
MLRNLNLSFTRGRILGTPKTGTLGADIPATGDNGGSYLRTDMTDMPADLARELCGRITRWPATGVLRAEENGAFSFAPAANGTESFDYQLAVFGVDVGLATVYLTSGSGVQIAAAAATATASGIVASVSQGNSIAALAGVAVADGFAASVQLGSAIAATQGTASAFGATAEVHTISGLQCDIGLAVASGAVASVFQGKTIACAAGEAAAAGLSAQVAASIFSFERSAARTLKIKAENRKWTIEA